LRHRAGGCRHRARRHRPADLESSRGAATAATGGPGPALLRTSDRRGDRARPQCLERHRPESGLAGAQQVAVDAVSGTPERGSAMTSPEIELTRVLETYAGDVQAHTDLVELVESRFQRRRRRRMRAAAVAAGMVVLLVVAGTAVAWPRAASRPTKPPVVTPSPTATPSPSCSPIYSCATGPLPKPPAFQAGHWAAPPAKIPLATTTWPTATFQLPARAPDGFKLRPLWTIDQTHVLVSSRSHGIIVAYYSFDLTNGGFRKIGEMPGGKQATSAGSAVSDHYLYWAFSGYNSTDFAKAAFDIYVAPLAGGATRK